MDQALELQFTAVLSEASAETFLILLEAQDLTIQYIWEDVADLRLSHHTIFLVLVTESIGKVPLDMEPPQDITMLTKLHAIDAFIEPQLFINP